MKADYENERYRCCLEILSPVHIGCDEIYEPTGFILDEQVHQIIVFEPFDFISKLESGEKQRFSDICRKGTIGSILEVYKFFQGKSAAGRRVKVCNDFPEHFRQTIALDVRNEKRVGQELNNFQIARTAYLPGNDRPYIPGSAIKGAIRTAYLNNRASDVNIIVRPGKYASRMLEERLLDYRGIPGDPFRLVKVSDFRPVGDVHTKILYAVNEKKVLGGQSARGPVQIFEVVEKGGLFEGVITVEKPHAGAKINHAVTLHGLLSSCLGFYNKQKIREMEELSKIGVKFDITGKQEDLEKGTPVRIGHHSGAEAVTIEGHRRIKIMGRRGEKPQILPYATTLWLASESRKPQQKMALRPFGWAQLNRVTAVREQDIEKAEGEYHDSMGRELGSVSIDVKQNGALRTAADAKASEGSTPKKKQEPIRESWKNILLVWTPNNGVITAVSSGKKATTSDKNLVPEKIHKKLFGKKKRAKVETVVVEKLGRAFVIINVS